MHGKFACGLFLRHELRNGFSFTSSRPRIQFNRTSRFSSFFALTNPLHATHHNRQIESGRADSYDLCATSLKESPPNETISDISENALTSDAVTDDGVVAHPEELKLEFVGIGKTSSAQSNGIPPITAHGPDSILSTNLSIDPSIVLAKEKVAEALRRQSPHGLLRWLPETFRDPAYIGSLPNTTIYEIFHLLDPQKFLDPLKAVYQGMHPNDLQAQVSRGSHPGRVFSRYVEELQVVVAKMVLSRQNLRLQGCKVLLNAAQSSGDSRAADRIWNDLLSHGGLPDRMSYIYYVQAKCWPSPFDRLEGQLSRITPYNLYQRRLVQRGFQRDPRWDWYQGWKAGPGGLKHEITIMFAQMAKQGIKADAKTFCLLMIAYAREGDMDHIKHTMKQVWNVDIELIMRTDDNSKQPGDLHSNSSLYPTPELLFTVAHVFGSNNCLAIAIRAIDHISQRYSLKIERRTWSELLNWASTLSQSSRKSRRLTHGSGVGQVPSSTVAWLWKVMTSNPESDTPTMHMLNLVIRSLYDCGMLRAMLDKMTLGLQLYNASLDRRALLFQQWTFVKTSLGTYQSQQGESGFVDGLAHELKLAQLEEERDFHMIHRWLSWLFKNDYANLDPLQRLFWQREKIPEVIEAFWSFRSANFMGYWINTGRVELNWAMEGEIATHEHHLKTQKNLRLLKRHVRAEEMQLHGKALESLKMNFLETSYLPQQRVLTRLTKTKGVVPTVTPFKLRNLRLPDLAKNIRVVGGFKGIPPPRKRRRPRDILDDIEYSNFLRLRNFKLVQGDAALSEGKTPPLWQYNRRVKELHIKYYLGSGNKPPLD